MTDLSEAIRQGWADARRDDPERTVGYFRNLLGQHPADARALFEYAGALDFADREAEAAPVYEQAFSAGLGGDDLRRGLIQYGSTLRNPGASTRRCRCCAGRTSSSPGTTRSRRSSPWP
jgi:tetratricopeptide repeat protein